MKWKKEQVALGYLSLLSGLIFLATLIYWLTVINHHFVNWHSSTCLIKECTIRPLEGFSTANWYSELEWKGEKYVHGNQRFFQQPHEAYDWCQQRDFACYFDDRNLPESITYTKDPVGYLFIGFTVLLALFILTVAMTILAFYWQYRKVPETST
jgi:hypothetical protein